MRVVGQASGEAVCCFLSSVVLGTDGRAHKGVNGVEISATLARGLGKHDVQ